jgi:hypothetical protein
VSRFKEFEIEITKHELQVSNWLSIEYCQRRPTPRWVDITHKVGLAENTIGIWVVVQEVLNAIFRSQSNVGLRPPRLSEKSM